MMHIVAEDLSGFYRPGHVMTNAQVLKMEYQRGLTLMPVCDSADGIEGFFKREFGEGRPMPNAMGAGAVARMALFLRERRDPYALHWRARVVGDADETFYGSLRLSGDTSQGLPSCGAAQSGQFNFSTLTRDMAFEGGWVVGGRALAPVQVSGAYGFALHGFARGLKLMWVALSQE